MKILLIDNSTTHLGELRSALSSHDVQIQRYKPGLEFAEQGKDLIILSGGGGEGQEIDDTYVQEKLWYEDQMSFILSSKKPIVGICMGFEVMAKAYGSEVDQMDKYLQGFKQIKATTIGRNRLESAKFKQFNAHGYRVQQAPKGFKVLAESATGIEAIAMKNRFATQFHPEVNGGFLDLERLIRQKPVSAIA